MFDYYSMKILIADTIFPKGHQRLNEKLISFLAEKNEVIIINNRGYYTYSKNKRSNIRECKLPLLANSNNFYLNSIKQLINSFILIVRCWFIKYDIVVFLTFDTVVFSVLRIGYINKKVYAIHHNNTDHLMNKLKMSIFKTYMNKINHIVFLPFIKEFLIKSGVFEHKISVLKHPITIIPNTIFSVLNRNRILLTGLGHANDESYIQDFIKYEETTHILESNDIFVVLRSQIIEYDNGRSIKVIKGYLQREVYDTYYKDSDGILIFYPPFFQNRFSGVLLDSLANRKKVLGPDIPVIRHYSKLYPNCCNVFQDIEDLFAQVIEKNFIIPEESFKKFQKDYSDEVIKRDLYGILQTKQNN